MILNAFWYVQCFHIMTSYYLNKLIVENLREGGLHVHLIFATLLKCAPFYGQFVLVSAHFDAHYMQWTKLPGHTVYPDIPGPL